MRVQVIPPGEEFQRSRTDVHIDYGGWRPRAVLGADAPGGLGLPAAEPTAAWLYAPRGVYVDDVRVIVADTGNHRVLIWDHVPTGDGVPSSVVLGQPDDRCEGPAAGGRGPENGMHLPTGVLVDEGRLVVADAWHHRILVWEQVPTTSATPPDHVIGQPDWSSVEANQGGECSATTMYWPFGIAAIDGRFYVADTGNRRVLIWENGLPLAGESPSVILGQPDPASREENRGADVGRDSFRWPHAFAATGDGGVMVADAGNHRLLVWNQHPTEDTPADRVFGQPDFAEGAEFPYISQVNRFRFPYAVSSHAGQLAIADTANNRVLIQQHTDRLDPVLSLGQPDLGANGENRWDRVADDTLCWPYGLHWHHGSDADVLAIADSGNNRVVLWERR